MELALDGKILTLPNEQQFELLEGIRKHVDKKSCPGIMQRLQSMPFVISDDGSY